MRVRRGVGAFRRADRGAVAIILAAALPAIVGFGALAVDVGSVYLTARRLQGVADLAAMAAARDIADAPAAANATVAANAVGGPVSVGLVTGQYAADPTLSPAARFQSGVAAPNAAQVTLQAQAPLYFGQLLIGRPSFTVSRKATAAAASFASFQIGSGLASLNGGVANSLLSALTGSTVSLSIMDYNALASANVDLFQYTSALQTRLSLQGASFSQVLSAKTSSGVLLSALADTLSGEGQTQAAGVASRLASAAGSRSPATLGGLVDLGPYAAQDHLSPGSGSGISLDALDLADAVLTLANGARQVQLDLGAAIPGLGGLTAYLAIGQRPSGSPWIAIDDAGSVTVRTAQARLYLDTKIAPGAGVLGPLGVTLIDAPIYVELAQAQAKLSALTCGAAPSDEHVDLSVSPSLGELALGSVDTNALGDFTHALPVSPATLLSLPPLIKATGYAMTTLGGDDWQDVAFSATDISNGTLKSVQTTNIASATLSSLLANTQVGVQLGGLGGTIGAGPVTGALQTALAGAGAPLDQVLNTLTAILGVRLGEADVKIDGVRCNGAALVA